MERTDLNQIAKQVSWLDEERRRDKDTITRLQSALDAQGEEMHDQMRRVRELEGRLASAQTRLTEFGALERMLEQFKAEIALILERYTEQRQEEGRDAARVRLVEQEKAARQANEMRKEFQRLSRLEEELNLCRAEEQRLGAQLFDMQHKFQELDQMLETRLRNLTYLEDRRAHDAKRMAQLQQETTEILKRQETMLLRTQALEEMGRRNEQRMHEFVASEAERNQRRREFLESVQRAEQARERQMLEWREMMETLQKRMDEAAEQMRRYHEHYMESKRMFENLQKLEERLNRSYNEMAELQRLGEARQKTRLEEWQVEDEKRMKKQLLLWEQQWRDHDRRNDEQLRRIADLEKQAQWQGTKLDTLWDLEESRMQNQTNQAQERLVRMGDMAAQAEREKKKP